MVTKAHRASCRRLTAAIVAAAALIAPSFAHAHTHSERAYMRHVAKPYRAFFERVAFCESRGQWHISTGNGYYGGVQFGLPAWRAVGGTGYPHTASKLEQIYRAVLLLRLQGAGAWPVCGRTA